MNQPWVYMCPPFWTPSHFPPHPIPQGCPSAPALSDLEQLFNCRLITLQYCSGFAIHWHESATGVHVFLILNLLPPPSPSHPSGSSQCTSPEHPVSCIESGLVIYFTYDNIHVSMLFSQNHPTLAFSHRVQKSVLCICVSFAVSHIGSSLPSF